MADVPIEWVSSLQEKIGDTDKKIDELGLHLDNKFQELDGKFNQLLTQSHKIELALSANWHETTQEVAKCRHTKANELQVMSAEAYLCKGERIKALNKVKEDFTKELTLTKEHTTEQLNKLTLLTTANKLKIGLYAGVGTAVIYALMRLVGL